MEQINARSIFSPATGFIRRGGFDWTCNPYVGCSFGCVYCYAMFLPQNRRPVQEWGRWVQAKANAVELARRQAPRLAGQAVYLSSVTDPYLPMERSLQLTRGILELIGPYQPRLVVQTRGPLVQRDVGVLKRFTSVRVNVSIPTDSEDVRLAFEPKAPRLSERWEAVRNLRQAGVPVGLCVTPTLPLANPDAFAEKLAGFEAAAIVTQEFHDSGGRFGADTRPAARQLALQSGWSTAEYARFRNRLSAIANFVYEGESGFFPPPPAAAS